MKPLLFGNAPLAAAVIVVFGASCCLLPSCAHPDLSKAHSLKVELSEQERAADFDTAWEFLRKHDGWLPSKPVDWTTAKTLYRPQAVAAKSNREFAAVLEQLLDELYDPHTHLQHKLGRLLVPAAA